MSTIAEFFKTVFQAICIWAGFLFIIWLVYAYVYCKEFYKELNQFRLMTFANFLDSYSTFPEQWKISYKIYKERQYILFTEYNIEEKIHFTSISDDIKFRIWYKYNKFCKRRLAKN